MSDKVPFTVTMQGAPALSHDYGYMAMRGDGVCAFYVDLDSKYCEVIATGGSSDDIPEIVIGAGEHSLHLQGDDHSAFTTISFPDFQFWDVHTAMISKYVMAVCLTDVRRFFEGGRA